MTDAVGLTGGVRAVLAGGRWPVAVVLCLNVWLHAADSLISATVMPSAVAEIGGVAWIYWTTALYELGSIVAGAVTGVLALRLGLVRAIVLAALIYAAGCMASALAPDMGTMLAGRLAQGLGGGWMMALSYVGVTRLFPASLWPAAFALVSAVWGVSAMVGPLVGGVFANAGLWRGAYWAFGAQALVLAAIVPVILRGHADERRTADRVPWRRICVFTAGLVAVLGAGVEAEAGNAGGYLLAGLVLLYAALRLEGRGTTRLFPPNPLSPATEWGNGFVMVLSLSLATVSFTVYGPLIMQILFGTSPLTAGLLIAVESVAWSVTAIVLGGSNRASEAACIRVGTIAVVAGVAGFGLIMPYGPVWLLILPAVLQGAGFGVFWAYVVRRIVAAVPARETERASSSVPTMQIIGYALGAALSGIVANLCGLGEGASAEAAGRAAIWVFVAFLPLGALGIWASRRFTARTTVAG